MGKQQKILLVIFFLSLLLVACTTEAVSTEDLIPPEDETAEATPEPVLGTADIPYAVLAAEEELSLETDISVNEIEIVSYEHVEWPNACLGFAEPGEMCAQVITPGWLIILRAEGEHFEFHTDEDGSDLRWRSQLQLT